MAVLRGDIAVELCKDMLRENVKVFEKPPARPGGKGGLVQDHVMRELCMVLEPRVASVNATWTEMMSAR